MESGFLKRVFSSQQSHQVLLGTLLFMMLVSPFLKDFSGVQWLMSILFIFVLLAAVRTMAQSRINVAIALSMAMLAAFGHFGVVSKPVPWIVGVRDLATAVFLFSVCLVLLRNILARSEVVTQDLIFGAVNVYLMAGLGFAFLFSWIELIQPGAFSGIGDLTYRSREVEPFVYFSYVTLSTLGYGDVSPTTNLSMTLAYVEAIFGQLFLAILVARLVGLYIAGGGSKR